MVVVARGADADEDDADAADDDARRCSLGSRRADRGESNPLSSCPEPAGAGDDDDARRVGSAWMRRGGRDGPMRIPPAPPPPPPSPSALLPLAASPSATSATPIATTSRRGARIRGCGRCPLVVVVAWAQAEEDRGFLGGEREGCVVYVVCVFVCVWGKREANAHVKGSCVSVRRRPRGCGEARAARCGGICFGEESEAQRDDAESGGDRRVSASGETGGDALAAGRIGEEKYPSTPLIPWLVDRQHHDINHHS